MLDPGQALSIGLLFEGVEALRYDIGSQTMWILDREHSWSLEDDGTLTLRVLFDVNCLEVFGPRGIKVMSAIYSLSTLDNQDDTAPFFILRVQGGPMRVKSMAVHPLRSIWQESNK